MKIVDSSTRKSALLGVLLSTALAAAGCSRSAPPPPGNGAQPAAAETGAAAPPSGPCGASPPTATPTLPGSLGGSQAEVDCAAWQAFIALNWKADPNNPGYPDKKVPWASFGTPGSMDPTVWETYVGAAAVFDGSVPLKGLWQRKRPAVKMLSRTSKFGDLDLSDIAQAGSGDHWLTNQRGDVTYYEIMMNRDEFEFITTQPAFDLTTASGQLKCAMQPGKVVYDGTPPPPPNLPRRGGLSMPSGNANGWSDTDCTGAQHQWGDGVGAMEIKAAWTPLPADHSLDYRYKTAIAQVRDPVTKTMRKVTVGLVGLHIIRKSIGRQQWVWATFEQIDNSPDEAPNGGFAPPVLPPNPNQRPSPGYTFFNPACTPQKDPTYRCQHNRPPRPCGTVGIVCDPYDKPMQITRLNPVADPANQVTALVWKMLPAKSVFNYYRLIGAQWPQDVTLIVPAQQRLPLPMGNQMPKGTAGGTGQIVANTSLESFQQSAASCMDCHANFASIAPLRLKATIEANGLRKVMKARGLQGLQPYSSDYSFIFLAETKR
ncbi:MAG TPA: hypothetical protein VFW19_16375 [Allosphingosinicella sp.]|nr:hypothetical protein [Allosphingosinicella sp.]